MLVILDTAATTFRRIWCDFELYKSLVDEKALDIVTMTSSNGNDQPQLLSQCSLPDETPYLKAQREQAFPTQLLLKGIYVKLEEGEASVSSDKDNILEYMAKDGAAHFVKFLITLQCKSTCQ